MEHLLWVKNAVCADVPEQSILSPRLRRAAVQKVSIFFFFKSRSEIKDHNPQFINSSINLYPYTTWSNYELSSGLAAKRRAFPLLPGSAAHGHRGKRALKRQRGKPLIAHPSENSRNTAVSEFDLRTPVIHIPSIHTILYTVPSSQTLCSLSQSPCLDIILDLSLIPQRLADFISLEKLGLKFWKNFFLIT